MQKHYFQTAIMENNRGFTIVELLVVFTIIIILTVIVVAGFPQIRLQLALSNAAYTFEQNARKAQQMSLSSMQYTDSQGVVHSIGGYGVYIDGSGKKYSIYADSVPSNRHYDPSDYIVDTVDLGATEPGIIIKQINGVANKSASIDFSPPGSMTTISGLDQAADSIDVVFAVAGNPKQTRTVLINTVGLIDIK